MNTLLMFNKKLLHQQFNRLNKSIIENLSKLYLQVFGTIFEHPNKYTL